MFLHPCERSVLEDLRPLLRGRLVAKVSRDLAYATLMIRLVRARVRVRDMVGFVDLAYATFVICVWRKRCGAAGGG